MELKKYAFAGSGAKFILVLLLGVVVYAQHPPNFTAELKRVEADLQAGRFQEAQSHSRELVKQDASNALAWTFLGMASVRLSQPAQAIDAYERAIAIGTKDARPFFDVALLYASSGDQEKAIDRYRKGLALDPSNETALFNYGRLLMEMAHPEEAATTLKHAVEIDPKDFGARTVLVEALLRSRKTTEAETEARAFLDDGGANAKDLVQLGALLVRATELDLAGEALRQALALEPNSTAAHLAWSRLSLARNDYSSAVESAARAVKLSPRSLETNLALAEAYISARRNVRAVEELTKVAPLFQQSAEFHYTLGIAQFRSNQFRPAIESFKKAVQLNPRMDLAHYLLGDALLGTGDLDQAETSLKTAIALNNHQPVYYNCLARLYEEKDAAFHQAALDNTNKALRLDPRDVEARHRLAKWAIDGGDLARARTLLEAIVHDAPSFTPARVLLATVYYRLNLRDQGKEQEQIVRKLEAEAQKHQRPPDQN